MPEVALAVLRCCGHSARPSSGAVATARGMARRTAWFAGAAGIRAPSQQLQPFSFRSSPWCASLLLLLRFPFHFRLLTGRPCQCCIRSWFGGACWHPGHVDLGFDGLILFVALRTQGAGGAGSRRCRGANGGVPVLFLLHELAARGCPFLRDLVALGLGSRRAWDAASCLLHSCGKQLLAWSRPRRWGWGRRVAVRRLRHSGGGRSVRPPRSKRRLSAGRSPSSSPRAVPGRLLCHDLSPAEGQVPAQGGVADPLLLQLCIPRLVKF